MPKNATLWMPKDSGTSVSTNEGFSYLLESGDILLQEDNASFYLLEPSVVTTKTPAVWAIPAKEATPWWQNDGTATFTTGTGDTRTTAAGDTRVTEDGNIRITELTTVNTKKPAMWTET
jgi:hypothetical protein